MWKKPEPELPRAMPSTPSPAAAKPAQPTERATIGHSISIKGELSGAEDLMVHGFVEGTIDLKQNTVTVGKTGRVTAHIYGRIIHVEGEVVGDLFGTEQVIVHMTGHVKGNITAPRVSLEDGAKVKGIIDTGPNAVETSMTSSASQAKSEAAPSQDAQKDNKDKGSKKTGQNHHESAASPAALQ